ncbi:hypothetical protein FRC07_007287, partial [Ceratobasidium sp. 392]
LCSAMQQLDAREWSGLEDSLIYIDAAFTSLEARRSQISSARAALGIARNRSKSLVPFNKFPDEIAAHIPSFLSADNKFDIRYDTARPDNQSLSSLLNVSATSKRLRELAIGTPSLWTRIDLVVGQSKDTYLRHGRHFLSYSKQLPLRIRIAGDVDENDQDEKVAKS